MTSKRQVLDPIGAGCRLILLHFSAPYTKIRITDHTIQLVENTYPERAFWRPWYFKDSREDVAALYPMIIRFIELYLMGKKTSPSSNIKKQHQEEDHTIDLLSEELQQFNFLGKMSSDSQKSETEIKPEATQKPETTENVEVREKCYKYLQKLGGYMMKGLEKLGKTYGQCAATFTLQFYCNLLKAGVEGTYTQDLLPPEMREFTASHDLLNSEKIKNLWSDANIIALGELFEKCFDAHKKNDQQMIMAYGAAISTILDARDEEFKTMMLTTDCA
jgi:hypothetical protein